MSTQQILWKQQRTFLQGAVNKLTEENKHKRLNTDTASAGFLMLHTVETIHLIAGMLFDQPMQIQASIQMREKDEGREIALAEIQEVLSAADVVMENVFQSFTDEKWQEKVSSPFGEITRLEGLGFLIYHTAYHVGQYMLTIKRGQ
jgi:uncharacterized damage-inducible protein DinB